MISCQVSKHHWNIGLLVLFNCSSLFVFESCASGLFVFVQASNIDVEVVGKKSLPKKASSSVLSFFVNKNPNQQKNMRS